MARVIITDGNGKRFTKEGAEVKATVGIVSGQEYYELEITAIEEGVPCIVVSKTSSKDPSPKEVYRVPQKQKVRKKASQESPGTTPSEA